MKARDIFGIIVRSFGMCVLLYALWYLAFAFAFLFRALHDTSHDSYMGPYFTSGIPGLVFAIVLLRFSRQIVRFSYPQNKDDSEV
jgi:hypothetical protein